MNWVKGITLLEELHQSNRGRSFSSTLWACIDKYLDIFSCPKVSQNLELSKAPKQTHEIQCAGLSLVEHSFGFGAGWLTKWTPNEQQLGLLESRACACLLTWVGQQVDQAM